MCVTTNTSINNNMTVNVTDLPDRYYQSIINNCRCILHKHENKFSSSRQSYIEKIYQSLNIDSYTNEPVNKMYTIIIP